MQIPLKYTLTCLAVTGAFLAFQVVNCTNGAKYIAKSHGAITLAGAAASESAQALAELEEKLRATNAKLVELTQKSSAEAVNADTMSQQKVDSEQALKRLREENAASATTLNRSFEELLASMDRYRKQYAELSKYTHVLSGKELAPFEPLDVNYLMGSEERLREFVNILQSVVEHGERALIAKPIRWPRLGFRTDIDGVFAGEAVDSNGAACIIIESESPKIAHTIPIEQLDYESLVLLVVALEKRHSNDPHWQSPYKARLLEVRKNGNMRIAPRVQTLKR